KPIKGAVVIAWRFQLDANRIDEEHTTRVASVIELKHTAVDGRFEFDFRTPELAGEARMLATAPGFGLGYLGKANVIRLRSGDLPISGRLVDLEGRPVAGVKIRLGQLMLPQSAVAQAPRAPNTTGAPVTKMRSPSGPQAAQNAPFSMAG